MKARPTARVPTGTWRCEMKFDGYRAIAVLNAGGAELWSRNHRPLSADYPEIVAALQKLKCRNATLDGEIVALDADGRSRFQLLQGRNRTGGKAPLVYYLFDLMHRDGKSLLDAPLEERRAQLIALAGKAAGPLQLSPVFSIEPAELLAAARAQQLEGIIAKRPGSRYEADRRSGAWVKCKLLAEQEFVVGGFTRPKNSREYFGAILVGYYRAGKLIYAGKIGTGFDRARLSALHAKFLRRARTGCPFANLPLAGSPRFGAGMTASAMKSVTWLKPGLVVQVRFAEWTADGLLRQPVFLGERSDKNAKDVHREDTLG
ncbi:MAG: non-homologous end-joining DNA ligase [Opitutaceae bacterium]